MNHTEELREELNKLEIEIRGTGGFSCKTFLGDEWIDQILSLLHKLNYQKVLPPNSDGVIDITSLDNLKACEPIEVKE